MALLPLVACSSSNSNHGDASDGGTTGGGADSGAGGSNGGTTATAGTTSTSTRCTAGTAVDTAACNTAGNVVQHDDCGDAIPVATCVTSAKHGACQSGACGCAEGYTGSDCAQCLVLVNGSSTTALDTNTGTSWSAPLKTVQAGLDLAATTIASGNVTACEVWVAAGTYYPTVESDSSDTTGRTKTLQLKSGVSLYGGFAGTEFLQSERNLTTNVTTLSGDLGTIGTVTDNAYHVVTGADNATLDGFTVTLGQADGSEPYNLGGGIYNVSVSPTVSNCIVKGNSASAAGTTYAYGGGMYNYSAAPTVSNCTFIGNSATSTGGFTAFGGGMYNELASPTIANCTFTENVASSASSYAEGGAIVSTGTTAASTSTTLTIRNSVFTNNTATTTYNATGGAVYVEASQLQLSNCVFSGNTAETTTGVAAGGGIYFDQSATVANCTFSNNSAKADASANGTGYGGGLYGTASSSLTMFNSIVWGNYAATNFEGLYSDGSSAVTYSDVQDLITSTINHIVSTDPLFINASLGDLQLQTTSPCLDAGYGGTATPTTDILGHARVDVTAIDNGGQGTPVYVDMGAYEYQGS